LAKFRQKKKTLDRTRVRPVFFFFIFEILVKFLKIKISKISPIYTTKTKISKNFPTSLSKIGEISPEKRKHRTRQESGQCFFLFFFHY